MQVRKKRCKWCGKELPDDEQKQEDPFSSEIYDDHTLMYICDDCYNERYEDI